MNKTITNLVLTTWMCLCAAVMAGCAPSAPFEAPTAVAGCSAGGPGVFVPADVRCTLDAADPAQVLRIDQETVMLLAEPNAAAAWAGAAIIYHIPTESMLVLDQRGDVDPTASVLSRRAGLAALSAVAGDAALMAGLKQQVQLRWPEATAGATEVRLSAAWQDGTSTVFMVAVAGLEATDARFYCASQTWTTGQESETLVPDCVAHEPGGPVGHVFFTTRIIRGDKERTVQVALDGVASNAVSVAAAAPATETLVYQAVLAQYSNRPLLVRQNTAPGYDAAGDLPAGTMDGSLVQAYFAANQSPASLRFLFADSSAYGVVPDAAIDRDFLPPDDIQTACEAFRHDYPGLGGVATLSDIGFSQDGAQALVHVLIECGVSNRLAAYHILAAAAGGWQVTNSVAAATQLPRLMPQLDYVKTAGGCGDIFVYRANRTRSEYILVSIDALAVGLSAAPVTLDLADDSVAIDVRIDVYADDLERLGENPYCNDVGPTAVPQSIWPAVSGRVTISATAGAQPEPCTGEPYQVTVVVEDAVFALGEDMMRLPSLRFDDVTVGWCAG